LGDAVRSVFVDDVRSAFVDDAPCARAGAASCGFVVVARAVGLAWGRAVPRV